jgi:hypothetical protein
MKESRLIRINLWKVLSVLSPNQSHHYEDSLVLTGTTKIFSKLDVNCGPIKNTIEKIFI